MNYIQIKNFIIVNWSIKIILKIRCDIKVSRESVIQGGFEINFSEPFNYTIDYKIACNPM